MVGLLNKECRSLARRATWQALLFEATFTTTAVESQGSLATIIGAQPPMRETDIIPETMWNRTLREPVLGPFSPAEWQASTAQVVTMPQNCYRIRGNRLLFMGTLTAGQTVAFEYKTSHFCTDVLGTTYRNGVAVDTDVLLVNDELALLGLIWRWKKAKGFDYGEDMAEYERQVVDAVSKDGTKPRLKMAGNELEGRGRPTIPRLIGS